MAPKIFFVFLIQCLLYKVYASQGQPVRYIVTSPQPSTAQTATPASPKPATSLSSLASLASLLSSGVPSSAPSGVPISSLTSLLSSGVPSVPSAAPSSVPMSSLVSLLSSGVTSSAPSSVPMSSLASILSSGVPTSLASLMAAVPTNTVTPPPPTPPPEKPSNGVEMELLNNLAVALQLMIVNNILASPTPETSTTSPNTPNSQSSELLTTFPSFDSFDPPLSYAPIQNDLPPIASQYQSYQPSAYDQQFNQMPNANYVGSSGFGGSNPLMSTVPPPMPTRSGLTLMSPYEALSPSSPWMDPILSSPYGSVMTSKHDFQSPYASILGADKDFFSMSSINDLF